MHSPCADERLIGLMIDGGRQRIERINEKDHREVKR
jgi:hypothetical protein